MEKVYLDKAEYSQFIKNISDSIPAVKVGSYDTGGDSDIMKKLIRVNRRLSAMTEEFRDGIENELIPTLKKSADRMDSAETEAAHMLKI